MANTLLTVDQITRESLRILHQKCTFLNRINKKYDDSFANEGAKIGDTLRIRLPNEYTVRTGATLSTEDTEEQSVTLPVQTQKGVDLNFTSADLTTDIDDFSKRIIAPAMSALASNIEADAYSMYKDVSQLVDNDASALTFKNIMQARQKLVDSLAPMDDEDNCSVILSTGHNVTLVDALKGLFNSQKQISDQYVKGMMGNTAGFNFYESTHASDHTTGTAAKTTGYVTDGAGQSGSTIVIDTGSTTFLKGDVITIAGVNSVHPETKTDTGSLKQFVVTADSGASATSLSISPSIVVTGGRQNVSNAVADGVALVNIGAGASELLNSSMAFHRDAFTFATADLVMPNGVDFASRQVFDGISMRIIRGYDINNDKFPCRLDVLYGYKTIREQLATRIHADG